MYRYIACHFFFLVTYKVSSFKIQDRVALPFENMPIRTCHLRLISLNEACLCERLVKFQPSSTTL